METISKFEEIPSWQKARQLTKEIYRLTTTEKFSKDLILRERTQRAAVSIMTAFAVGFGRKTNKDYASFLVLAHGFAAEVKSCLYVALDLQYIDQQAFDKISEWLDQISNDYGFL
ncbi:MAG: four helix bundle protein [Actinomycetota bacterium]